MNEIKNPTHTTRESWLAAAVELMKPMFKTAGKDIPPLAVSCGWPSSRGLPKAGQPKTIGQCWDGSCSADGRPQIFISPSMDNEIHFKYSGTWDSTKPDPKGDCMGVLPTLVHEVVHGVLGCAEGHNKVFGKLARAVGLEGKLTATHAGEKLAQECADIARILGPYPHAAINPQEIEKQRKKQTTRQLKCECSQCGYIARISKKWLDAVGAPHCPQHGAMEPEVKDEGEEGEGDE
jgi:hypothetical protein